MPILLLMIYSFLMGATVAFFYTASTSIMLTNFDIRILPYTYIGGGLAAYLFWIIYSNIEKKLKFSSLLIFANIFLIVSVTILVLGVIHTDNKWFSFVMYVWIRIFAFVTFVGFWGIASRIFDIRQGKRLFGLISTGEVISDIIGFFSIPLLLNFFKTEDLLYISIFGLLLCIIILVVINKRFRKELSIKVYKNNTDTEGSDENDTNDAIPKNYYLYLGLMAFLPMISIAFADYLFMIQTKVQYTDKEVLSQFLAIFFGLTAVAEFVVKTFLSGKLLSKYGIKIGLASAPFLLIIGIGLAAASGVIFGITAMFSSFILLSKILERVMRTSVYDPSFQILYQPLSASKRLFFQSRIEGIAKTGGNILAGVSLLMLLSFEFFNSIIFTIIYLVLLFVWLKYSFVTHEKYRDSLRNILFSNKAKYRIENDTRLSSDVYYKPEQLTKSNFELFFSLYNFLYPDLVKQISENLLINGSRELKDCILQKLEGREIILSSAFIENCCKTEENSEFKGRLLLLKNNLMKIEEYDFDVIKKLAGSQRKDDRILASQLLGISRRFGSYKILTDLFSDDDPDVRSASIYTIGKIARPEIWNLLIDSLKFPIYRNIVINSIIGIGDEIIPYLNSYFNKFNTPKNIKILIIKIITNIGGNAAIKCLKGKINFPEKEIRDEVIKSLSSLAYKASSLDESIIKNLIDEEIETLIWIMASILDLESHYKGTKLMDTLNYELSSKRKQIFQMLSMLYDSETIRYIWDNIEGVSSDARVLSLELIDIFLSRDLKEKILILFEEISLSECIENFRDTFPQKRLKTEERLREIINKDYTKISIWTKACTFDEISRHNNPGLIDLFESNVTNPNLLLSELAVYSLYKMDVNRYKEFISFLSFDERKRIGTILTRLLGDKFNPVTYFEMIDLIRNTDIFYDTSHENLVKLATKLTLIELEKDEILNCRSHLCLYILVSGGITESFGKHDFREHYNDVGRNKVILSFGVRRINQYFTAITDSILIEIPFETVYDLNLLNDGGQIYRKIMEYNYENYKYYDIAYENRVY